MKNNSKYLTFLYHEATDNPSDSGFQRNSALPYKHKVEEFYSNIDIIEKNRKNIITVDKLNTHSINNNVIQNIPVLAASGRGSPWIPEIIYSLLYDKHDIKYNLKRSDLKEKIVYEYLNKEKIFLSDINKMNKLLGHKIPMEMTSVIQSKEYT